MGNGGTLGVTGTLGNDRVGGCGEDFSGLHLSAGPSIMVIKFLQAQEACHDLSNNGGLFRYPAFDCVI